MSLHTCIQNASRRLISDASRQSVAHRKHVFSICQRPIRRSMASASAETQHKVWIRTSFSKLKANTSQLLAANLEEADPAVFDILEKVCSSRDPTAVLEIWQMLMHGLGEKKTEAFDKSYPLGEFHFSSGPGGFRECYAKYACRVVSASRWCSWLNRQILRGVSRSSVLQRKPTHWWVGTFVPEAGSGDIPPRRRWMGSQCTT